MTDPLGVAVEAARKAGEILKRRFGKVNRVEFKGEINIVTEADTEAEEVIKEGILSHFPGAAIMAEESGWREGSGEEAVRWFVDPIDGTTNFAAGIPHFCTSIAYEREGRLTAGVVFDPLRGELFTARRGEGALLNGKPLEVARESELVNCVLATGFPYTVRRGEGNNLDHWENFLFRVRSLRRLGAAALDLAYVAAGRLNGFWEPGLYPWDMTAGALLVRESGGRVTDFAGREYEADMTQVVAANPDLSAKMLSVLQEGQTGLS